jgi:chaperonin cofactor prefoldin
MSDVGDMAAHIDFLAEQLAEAVNERDALQARIDAYEGHLEEWEEIDRLIAASSLGTPEAVAMREQVPPQLSKVLVRAIQAQQRADAAEAERDRLRAVVDDPAGPVAKTMEYLGRVEAERDRLRAVVDEHEHALNHVVVCPVSCLECREVARSALAHENLSDFMDQLDVSPDTGDSLDFPLRDVVTEEEVEAHRPVDSYVCPAHNATGGYESCCECGGWHDDDPDRGRLCSEAQGHD